MQFGRRPGFKGVPVRLKTAFTFCFHVLLREYQTELQAGGLARLVLGKRTNRAVSLQLPQDGAADYDEVAPTVFVPDGKHVDQSRHVVGAVELFPGQEDL
jgi:hypothetical protein